MPKFTSAVKPGRCVNVDPGTVVLCVRATCVAVAAWVVVVAPGRKVGVRVGFCAGLFVLEGLCVAVGVKVCVAVNVGSVACVTVIQP